MDNDVDLVLIGGQGRGKEKSMLGSVSNQVVNRCTKQVLVVK
jgi:nucleotide-binding universal stress UspA family protein